jgi:hypothetical protein
MKFSPDLQAEVGDHFGHPQGVQVKALNSRFGFHPSNAPLGGAARSPMLEAHRFGAAQDVDRKSSPGVRGAALGH